MKKIRLSNYLITIFIGIELGYLFLYSTDITRVIVFVAVAILLALLVNATLIFIEVRQSENVDHKHFFRLDRLFNRFQITLVGLLLVVTLIESGFLIRQYAIYEDTINSLVIRIVGQAIGIYIGAKIIIGFTFNEDRKKFSTDTDLLLKFYRDEEYLGKEEYLKVFNKARDFL